MTITKNIKFLPFGWSLPPRFDITNLEIDYNPNDCPICSGKPTRAHRKIWDGKDFIEMGQSTLESFELYELKCMASSLEYKDYWNQLDHDGMDLIDRIIRKKEEIQNES